MAGDKRQVWLAGDFLPGRVPTLQRQLDALGVDVTRDPTRCDLVVMGFHPPAAVMQTLARGVPHLADDPFDPAALSREVDRRAPSARHEQELRVRAARGDPRAHLHLLQTQHPAARSVSSATRKKRIRAWHRNGMSADGLEFLARLGDDDAVPVLLSTYTDTDHDLPWPYRKVNSFRTWLSPEEQRAHLLLQLKTLSRETRLHVAFAAASLTLSLWEGTTRGDPTVREILHALRAWLSSPHREEAFALRHDLTALWQQRWFAARTTQQGGRAGLVLASLTGLLQVAQRPQQGPHNLYRAPPERVEDVRINWNVVHHEPSMGCFGAVAAIVYAVHAVWADTLRDGQQGRRLARVVAQQAHVQVAAQRLADAREKLAEFRPMLAIYHGISPTQWHSRLQDNVRRKANHLRHVSRLLERAQADCPVAPMDYPTCQREVLHALRRSLMPRVLGLSAHPPCIPPAVSPFVPGP